MSDKDDDEEERQRQRKENRRMAPKDRWHKKPPLVTKSGRKDLRSNLRTGRVEQMNVKLTPLTRAKVEAILDRDQLPSFAVMFEEMVDIYLEKHGALDPKLIPTDEELAEIMEEASFKDGE
jgi:hypothetical protein